MVNYWDIYRETSFLVLFEVIVLFKVGFFLLSSGPEENPEWTPLNCHKSKLSTHQRGVPTLELHVSICKTSGISTSLNTEVMTLWLLIRLPVKIPWVTFLGDLCASNVSSTAVAWAVTLCLPVLYNPKVTSSLNCKMRSYNALTNCNKTFTVVLLLWKWNITSSSCATQIIRVNWTKPGLMTPNQFISLNWNQLDTAYFASGLWFFSPTLTKAFEKALYSCFGRGVDARTRDEMITAPVLNQLGTARWFRLSRASSVLCLPLATLKL